MGRPTRRRYNPIPEESDEKPHTNHPLVTAQSIKAPRTIQTVHCITFFILVSFPKIKYKDGQDWHSTRTVSDVLSTRYLLAFSLPGLNTLLQTVLAFSGLALQYGTEKPYPTYAFHTHRRPRISFLKIAILIVTQRTAGLGS